MNHRPWTLTCDFSSLFQIHDFHIQMARQSFEAGDDDGPLIECSVYDCGRYERNDLVGRLSVRLKDVIPFGAEVGTQQFP